MKILAVRRIRILPKRYIHKYIPIHPSCRSSPQLDFGGVQIGVHGGLSGREGNGALPGPAARFGDPDRMLAWSKLDFRRCAADNISVYRYLCCSRMRRDPQPRHRGRHRSWHRFELLLVKRHGAIDVRTDDRIGLEKGVFSLLEELQWAESKEDLGCHLSLALFAGGF